MNITYLMGNKNHKCNNFEKKFNEDFDEELYTEFLQNLNLKIDTKKLEENLKNCSKNNKLIVLIESGSLAPPHRMHLGLMEQVKKYFEDKDKNNLVIGGFIVPSSDKYVRHKLKQDFIPLNHRVNMTKILIKNSNWLECLDWDLAYGEEIKIFIDLLIKKQFPKYKIKSFLIFGVDFYSRLKISLKSEQVCIYRPGYDLDSVKKMYTENLLFVEGNDDDISSTKIRKAIRDNDQETIKTLMSEDLIEYINNNRIFQEK